MGWGRTLFLGDVGNRLDIQDTERDIDSLKREIRGSFHKDLSQDQKIEKLIAENAEMKLYLASLIRLLTSKGAISPAELSSIVEQVDAEDGKSDGQFSGNLA